jgi:anti-sigma B factor antagonist
MERHQVAMAASVRTRNEGGTVGSVASQARTAFNKSTRTRAASSEVSLPTAEVSVWMHTLILTGELDRASAHALEAEIERFCAQGVTGITLDLRELTYIDSVGVAVIAFRWGLCHRQGYEFALIPGSRFIHRAFEQAGLSDLLPFVAEEALADTQPAVAEPSFAGRLGPVITRSSELSELREVG